MTKTKTPKVNLRLLRSAIQRTRKTATLTQLRRRQPEGRDAA
jgi:hypothetical protein